MIQAVIFDFGNVICNFDYHIFLRKISEFTQKSEIELSGIIYNGIHQKYETGLLSSEEFYEQVSTLCELKMNMEDFRKAFTEIFTPIRTTCALLKKLKLEYKIGLLSNTNEWHFENSIKTMEIFNVFDAMSLSYQVGAMKPDTKIFYDILDKLVLKPDECIYIDDVPEFVDVAGKLGFKGIRYAGYEELLASLKKLHITLLSQ